MTLMISGVIQRQLWRPFHMTSSKIVLKSGLGAGIGAYLPNGNTLKAVTVVFSNEVCNNFTAMSSRTLLTPTYKYVIYIFSSVVTEFSTHRMRLLSGCLIIHFVSVKTFSILFKIHRLRSTLLDFICSCGLHKLPFVLRYIPHRRLIQPVLIAC